MKKIWITGAEGHIGTALLELLEGVEYQLLPTDIREVDITKIDEVTQFVYVNRPDVIINCAGMTDVAECEKNIDEAYRVNAIGVRNVALAAISMQRLFRSQRMTFSTRNPASRTTSLIPCIRVRSTENQKRPERKS